jgi:hypothetical protein
MEIVEGIYILCVFHFLVMSESKNMPLKNISHTHTHTHTHTLKKCQGLPALSVKWIVIKRRNVNTGWLVPPALHFPHQPLKNLTN